MAAEWFSSKYLMEACSLIICGEGGRLTIWKKKTLKCQLCCFSSSIWCIQGTARLSSWGLSRKWVYLGVAARRVQGERGLGGLGVGARLVQTLGVVHPVVLHLGVQLRKLFVALGRATEVLDMVVAEAKKGQRCPGLGENKIKTITTQKICLELWALSNQFSKTLVFIRVRSQKTLWLGREGTHSIGNLKHNEGT